MGIERKALNQSRQPALVERHDCLPASLARRGCVRRWPAPLFLRARWGIRRGRSIVEGA